MVKKASSRYVCSNCGGTTSAWSGRCPYCGEWNTLQEELVIDPSKPSSGGRKLKASPVDSVIRRDQLRLKSEINGIDEVLGGGLVLGSVSLLAGQPGIGKSTLLLQYAYSLSKKNKVLYVSGEESAHQIGLRASRLGVSKPSLSLANSNSADDIAATIESGEYQAVIVDSIQTTSTQNLNSASGTVSQITGQCPTSNHCCQENWYSRYYGRTCDQGRLNSRTKNS